MVLNIAVRAVLTAIIAVLFQTEKASCGAYNEKLLWPERDALDRMYDVPYYFYDVQSQYLMIKVRWALYYLTRGSNLHFVESHYYDSGFIFYQKETSYLERDNSVKNKVTFYIDEAITTADVLRLALKALGMVEEHLRKDRETVLALTGYAGQRYPIEDTAVLATDYDVASIMHPVMDPALEHVRAGVSVRDATLREAAEGHRGFLSSCDWVTLGKMYPGIRPLPTCVPGSVPLVTVPSYAFLRLNNFNRTFTERECRFNVGKWYDDAACRFHEGREFPKLHWLKEEVYTFPSTVPIGRIHRLCRYYKSRDTSILSHKSCFSACVNTCPQRFPMVPLAHCMKYKFSVCKVFK